VKYVDAYQNTDVVQAHQGSKLKEDIILKKPGHPEKFEYQIDMKELEFEKVSNGDINFLKRIIGETADTRNSQYWRLI